MSSLLTLVSLSGLLDLALKSAAIVLLAIVAVAVLGRASAAWRHLVWCLSVVSLLVLPALSLVLPDWRVTWLPRWTAQPTRLDTTVRAGLAGTHRTRPLDDATVAFRASAAAAETEPHEESQRMTPTTTETTSPRRRAMPWLARAWPAGALLLLVPLAIGLWQLADLHRRSQVISDPRWRTLLDELRRQLSVRRKVQLRRCESALAPLTWGALRPVVLMPFEAGDWPDGRRRLVLLHELAHVRRWDWLTQLVAHVTCAVYWFNPLVWLAARQMRIERERACDDIVLTSGARASDYARELLALAAGLSDSQASTLVAVPITGRSLDDRLRGILDRRRSRTALTRSAVCMGAALAAAAMAPLAMLRAAPPESTQTETREQRTEPAPAPAEDAAAVRRQADGIEKEHAPLAMDNDEVQETWNLTIEEAIQTALANSKVVRNMGGLLFTPAVRQSLPGRAPGRTEGPTRDPNASRGTEIRFVLARSNDEFAMADFEAGVRNLTSDLQRVYWDLYYNYRNLDAVMAGRNSALATWRKVHALQQQGEKGGEAEKEAQAREQYFLFRAQVENTLQLLYASESRLRNMMGLAPTDGRLIRPADNPTTADLRFDWKEVVREAIDRSGDLSKDQELDLTHVLTNSIRDVDRNYQVSRTTFNRRDAATRQLEAVNVAYKEGTGTLEMVLDGQRRLADAEIAYHRAVVDYHLAILQVHFRKGSLLQRNGILLTERIWREAPPIDPFRKRAGGGGEGGTGLPGS